MKHIENMKFFFQKTFNTQSYRDSQEAEQKKLKEESAKKALNEMADTYEWDFLLMNLIKYGVATENENAPCYDHIPMRRGGMKANAGGFRSSDWRYPNSVITFEKDGKTFVAESGFHSLIFAGGKALNLGRQEFVDAGPALIYPERISITVFKDGKKLDHVSKHEALSDLIKFFHAAEDLKKDRKPDGAAVP